MSALGILVAELLKDDYEENIMYNVRSSEGNDLITPAVAEHEELLAKIASLEAEVERLKAENKQLKQTIIELESDIETLKHPQDFD